MNYRTERPPVVSMLWLALLLGLVGPTTAQTPTSTAEPSPEDSLTSETTAPSEEAEATPQDEEDEEARLSSYVDNIVVTAERRATFFQETPISMVALGPDDLDQMNVDGLKDLHYFVPNFNIGGDVRGGEAFPLFMIRGVGQAAGSAGLERGVGLYVDDVYYPRTSGSLLRMLDLNRLEVLRGPQGTLFGRNTTGGAVRYISNPPSDQFEGYIRSTAGTLGRVDLQGVVNYPFSERTQGRLHFFSGRSDSYIDYVGEDALDTEKELVVGGVLRFQPSYDATIDFRFSHVDIEGPMVPQDVLGFRIDFFTLGMARVLADAGESPLVADDPRFVLEDPFLANGRCFLVNPQGLQFPAPNDLCDYRRTQKYTTASLDIHWDFHPSVSFRSLTAVIDGTNDVNFDFSGLNKGSFQVDGSLDSFSQEFQFSGATNKLDWIAGLFYFRETPDEFRLERTLSFFGVCCGEQASQRDYKTESFGLFGQATYRISDRLNFTGGLRYSRDDKTLDVVNLLDPDNPVAADDSWDSIDYRATLDFDLADDVMVFATLSKGFKSGGFSVSSLTFGGQTFTILTPYDPEEVINHELGLRSQWLDDRIRLNLTGYLMKYENLVTANPLGFSANGGDVDITGFELDAAMSVTPRFQVMGSIGHSSLDVKRLADFSELFLTSTCEDPFNPTLETCDVLDLPRAPEWTYALEAQWIQPLANSGLLRTTATYGYTSELQTSNQASTSLRLDDYALVNLRVQYDDPKGRFAIGLEGTNVTDEVYYTSGVSLFGSSQTAVPGRPQEWGLDVRFNF